MGLINKTTFKILSEQTGEVKRLLTPPTNFTNLKGLKYAPEQLSTDIVEKSLSRDGDKLKETLEKLLGENKSKIEIAEELNISRQYVYTLLKRFGFSKSFVGPKRTTDTIIKEEDLRVLVDSKKTLSEMAEELNVSVGKVRIYLNKYQMKNPDLEELEILRNYFSATTPKEKAEIFASIDEYLVQIAKEKCQVNKSLAFDDCLQDVRLGFLELAEKRKNGNSSVSRNLFKELRKPISKKQEDIEIVDLELALDKADELDNLVQNFENNDFMEYLITNSRLGVYQRILLKDFIKEPKTLNEMEGACGQSLAVVKYFLKKAAEKIGQCRRRSENLLNQRSEIGWSSVKHDSDKLIPLKNSNYYYRIKE